MNGFVVVGTDTDAGKTAFSLLFLTAFADRFEYWKPVETGEPDSLRIRRLVPEATVHEPLARFSEPVAPALAARRAGRRMPVVAEILASTPRSEKPLLIETFGGPLSPLTDDDLQLELIRGLGFPVVLVSQSSVGAIGRTLLAAQALIAGGVEIGAVALIGPHDDYAAEQIARHRQGLRAVALQAPAGEWTADSLREAAKAHHEQLSVVEGCLNKRCADPVDLIHRDRRAIWHPYTPLADSIDPLPVLAAEREFLHLADGRTIIDAVSSWWTILHGHCHRPLVEALTAAAHTLDHTLFAGATHPPAIEFAEMILRSAPWPGGRIFYSDNGSTAVEVALKMAYQFWLHRGEPQRTLFVGFENGYHGDTFGAMAVGRDPVFFGAFDPFLFHAVRIPVSADRLDAVLRANAGKVAAIILEPLVQGAGGMRMHSPAELRAIFDVAKQHGVLFIADEVMTAFRTGSIWAHAHAGIAPDLICAAKTLAGGILPLAATLASPAIVAAFDTPDRTKMLFHGHSFTANPLACAVAVANWRLIEEGHWTADVERICASWRLRLEPLRARRGVKDVRIRGSIAAVELDSPGGYLAEVGQRVRKLALDRGVLLRPLGPVVYAIPPLCTSNESLGRIASAIESAVESLEA